ncbi:LysR family transcriptional regulator [Cognatiyoonia sp. IB215446]|uniref:LysR family transcriptional regulator n=1 Tax=Cognatiyoonia sp. IB215446 TaxID=3097355 RepID=UPI002A139C43|nr:LysR family transcriptional regulator [Cognatiyoonia sp. IB215446]MDX8349112.1 LysR family transcriptional regulator [Cognatiyoonia sp. IB215446]
MELALLQTFSDVTRRGSFAAVARDEGVDPSSVSRRVAALEEVLGLALFERTTRRLALTEAGRIYLDRVGPILEGLAEAADTARDAVTEPSGLLRVTTSVAFGERWLTPRLAGFRMLFPRVQIELILSDGQIDIAAEGIDVALRLGSNLQGTFVVSKLFDVRYRAVAAPGYLNRMGRPAHPADLKDHDAIHFALPRFGSAWRFRVTPGSRPIEVQPRPALAISNALAIRRAALEGLGVALLADWTVSDDLERGRLVDLFPEHEGSATDFYTAVWTVYASRHYMPARLRAFLDYVRDYRV